jgi:subtilase family serine protease
MVHIRDLSRRAKWLAASAPAAAAIAVVTALTGAAAPSAAAAGQPASRVPLPSASQLVPSGATDTGSVPSSQTAAIRVYLAGRDPAGLRALAAQVSTPGAAQYGRYLTPAQYAARFGPTARQVASVSSWLAGCGMQVTTVTQQFVGATGNQSAVSCVTGAQMHSFRWQGKPMWALAGHPSMPGAVASDVLSVTGLSSLTPTAKPAAATPATTQLPAATSATCSAYFGATPASTLPAAYGAVQPWHVCGYTPSQMRSAYGAGATGLTGQGTTVAIVDVGASATMSADAQKFASLNGGQPWAAGQYTEVVPAGLPAQPLSWTEEEATDVEAVHTMAPSANVVYVAAAGTADTDFLDALAGIVNNHLADIVSGSWVLGADTGIPAATVAAFELEFLQGAVEGIGFIFASGDTGSQASSQDGSGPLVTATQYPASDPLVTAVGGTTLAIGSSGQYSWEAGWETDFAQLSADGTSWAGLPGSFANGSGGGESGLFPMPPWQRALVGSKFGNHRVVPDVAMDADQVTGMLVGLSFPLPTGPAYVQFASGGTSQATPLFAGMQALAQQHAGHPLGLANPVIYAAARTGAFHDVTDAPAGQPSPLAAAYIVTTVSSTGTLSQTDVMATFGQSASAGLATTPGFDDVTGVGSPTAGYLTWPFPPHGR